MKLSLARGLLLQEKKNIVQGAGGNAQRSRLRGGETWPGLMMPESVTG
jgi:hypothetical protein